MCGTQNPSLHTLIEAVKNVINDMRSKQMVQKRRNIISHVPIAMLECIAARGADPYKYHARPHKTEI
jgi:hypothetical protein